MLGLAAACLANDVAHGAWDTNSDGRITSAELAHKGLSSAQTSSWVSDHDANGDGGLDEAEWRAAIAEKEGVHGEAEVAKDDDDGEFELYEYKDDDEDAPAPHREEDDEDDGDDGDDGGDDDDDEGGSTSYAPFAILLLFSNMATLAFIYSRRKQLLPATSRPLAATDAQVVQGAPAIQTVEAVPL